MKKWKSILLSVFFLMFLLASVKEICYAPPPPGPPGGGPPIDPPGGGPPDRGPVPEPATAALIAIGAAGIYGYKKFTERHNSKEP